MTPTFQEHYKKNVMPKLKEKFGYTSAMQIPRIEKITLNMGLGEALTDKKVMAQAVEELRIITGQQPVVTKARKSIAGFKVRDGWPVGCKVTLRRRYMYEFFERLVGIALPRVRDFRGYNPKSFDGRGNFSLGIKEQTVFAEIDYDKVDKTRGMDIIITTSAKTDEEGFALLEAFGFPFAKRKVKKEEGQHG